MEVTKTASTSKPTPNQPAMAGDPLSDEQVRKILQRAHEGKDDALEELKRVLDEHPEVWQRLYDLVSTTEQSWLENIAGNNHALSQSIRRRLEQMKIELAGVNATPLEHLLSERIGMCWLSVHHAELAESIPRKQSSTLKVSELRLKRLDAANRRLLAAVKALAVVRRLTGGLKIELHHTAPLPGEHPQTNRPREGRGIAATEEVARARLNAMFGEEQRIEASELISA